MNEHLKLRYKLYLVNRLANIFTYLIILAIIFVEYLRFRG